MIDAPAMDEDLWDEILMWETCPLAGACDMLAGEYPDPEVIAGAFGMGLGNNARTENGRKLLRKVKHVLRKTQHGEVPSEIPLLDLLELVRDLPDSAPEGLKAAWDRFNAMAPVSTVDVAATTGPVEGESLSTVGGDLKSQTTGGPMTESTTDDIDKRDRAILRTLAKITGRKDMTEIETDLARCSFPGRKKKGIHRKTIGKHCTKLTGLGLVDYDHRNHKGAKITDEGRACLSSRKNKGN